MPDRTTTLRGDDAGPGPMDCPETNERRTFLLAMAVLAALTLAMFGDVLFTGDAVLGREREDITGYFVPRRQFGFEELRGGNLALWNPHLFSGLPMFATFESALLYPLNFLYLLAPLVPAINWTIALHVFLGGMFMYLWARHRGLSPLARLLAAVLFMFCGSHFLNIGSGHLGNLAALIWSPLVLLSVDGLFRPGACYYAKSSRPVGTGTSLLRRSSFGCEGRKHEPGSFGWCLLGAFAVCMQILAGHPQYVFFTAVTAGLYTALCLVRARGRWRVAAGFAGMYLGGAALSAVQLLTGLDAIGEAVRSGGATYSFASTYPLPPENLATLVVPGFFGDTLHLEYWGRWNHFEMTPFVGVTAVVLAVCGAVLARREVRRFSAAMILICMVLALGNLTPLHRFLYDYVPGFSSVRVMSRYAFQASLFIAMLAGAGLDELLRRGRACRRTALAVAIAAAAAAAAALVMRYSASAAGPGGWWHDLMRRVYLTGQTTEALRVPGRNLYEDAAFVRSARLFTSRGLLIAAGTALLLAGLLGLRRFTRRAVVGVALLAMVEVLAFARLSRPTAEYPVQRVEGLGMQVAHIEEFLAGRKGDYRIMNVSTPWINCAMVMPWQGVWGEDSFAMKRYVEFMAFTQGGNLDEADESVAISQLHALHKMLRWRFTFVFPGDKMNVTDMPDPMGRLELIRRCRVVKGRDRIFAAMAAKGFDPRRTVILETPPQPWPSAFAKRGSARVVDSSTDHLTIEADLPAPAILLITDTYADGWRAVALPGSVQQSYQLMPGNYTLRAVPLKAGKHRLRVEYSPLAFRVGVWVSAVSAAAYLALLGWHVRRSRAGGPAV